MTARTRSTTDGAASNEPTRAPASACAFDNVRSTARLGNRSSNAAALGNSENSIYASSTTTRDVAATAEQSRSTVAAGIELPGEAPGILRGPGRWSALSQSSMIIGQEIGVTPLQLATAVSAIANGGLLMRPYLVEEIRDAEGNLQARTEPEIRRRVANSGWLPRMSRCRGDDRAASR